MSTSRTPLSIHTDSIARIALDAIVAGVILLAVWAGCLVMGA